MAGDPPPVHWAPRIPKWKIRRLYELDARGLADEELLDEVAYGLRARLESIMTVTRVATTGILPCPGCGTPVTARRRTPGERLSCPACPWRTTWGEFHRTYRGKQLFGGNARWVFDRYLSTFPKFGAPRARMIWIDQLLHEFHFFLGRRSRSVVANLIEGRTGQALAFLDELTYGRRSP